MVSLGIPIVYPSGSYSPISPCEIGGKPRQISRIIEIILGQLRRSYTKVDPQGYLEFF
jgi:hypothetical protein